MNDADLVICRAGATTLAEITAAGKPAILIPLPTATDDHQRKNAEVLVKAGAAEVIDQRELSGNRLAVRVMALAADPAGRAGHGPGRARAGQARGGARHRRAGDGVDGSVAAVLGPTRRAHFIGVGGSGMSPLAEILLRGGHPRQRIGLEGIGRDRTSAGPWPRLPRGT